MNLKLFAAGYNREMAKGDFAGQVAVVMGGGRGLGRAYAEALAAAGSAVVIAARSPEQLDATAAGIGSRGGHAVAVVADVTDPAAVDRVFAAAEQSFGRVDLLVNCAGIGGPFGPAWDTEPRAWWRCQEVNLFGAYLCCRAAVPLMVARGRGRIINVSSGAGQMCIPYMSAYVTSKAALTKFSEVLAAEVRQHGIAVFAIEPGTVRTPLAESVLNSPDGQRWLPWFPKIFDEHRDVTAEYSAEMVLLLASGRADALSGRFLSRGDNIDAMLAATP